MAHGQVVRLRHMVGGRLALPAEPDKYLAFLSATRSEMYTALDLFHRHVQHTISLQLGLIGSALLVAGVVHRMQNPSTSFIVLSALGGLVVLGLVPALARRSSSITWRYYRLYVAALVYSADLHEAAGLGRHEHFLEIKREYADLMEARRKAAEAKGEIEPPPLSDDERVQVLVKLRASAQHHTWSMYAQLSALIGWAAVAIGVLLLLLSVIALRPDLTPEWLRGTPTPKAHAPEDCGGAAQCATPPVRR